MSIASINKFVEDAKLVKRPEAAGCCYDSAGYNRGRGMIPA